jgi:hypothetical protein
LRKEVVGDADGDQKLQTAEDTTLIKAYKVKEKATHSNMALDLVQIGDFTIDINKLERATYLRMRLILPGDDYQQVKRRINARF